MKRNKGFTLIELLGVLIVLSAIALITIPVVTGVMKDARKSSFEVSTKNLIKAADNYYADKQLEINKTIVFDFDTREGKNEDGEELAFKGTKPNGGRVIIAVNGEVTLQDVTNGDYYANYDGGANEDVVITETNQVMTRDELTDAIKQLQDELKKTNTKLDSTTTVANTANKTANDLNNSFLEKTYPVGSIYVSNSNTNPGTIFGGTWVAFGSGRTLVGVSTSDTNYNTVEKTGGSNSQSITLTTANLPSHTHTVTAKGTVSSTFTGSSATTSEAAAHGHGFTYIASQNGSSYGLQLSQGTASTTSDGYIQLGGKHSHTVTAKGTVSSTFTGSSATTSSVGSSTAFSVSHIQPYITVYMWKRTA